MNPYQLYCLRSCPNFSHKDKSPISCLSFLNLGLGSVAASLDHDDSSVVFWVDAHADINTMSSSNSGNMHGMPVSFNIPQLKERIKDSDWYMWTKIKLNIHLSRNSCHAKYLKHSIIIIITCIRQKTRKPILYKLTLGVLKMLACISVY